ncbi:MAG TPA: 50S ribosomal protein L11 methyltransferase [Rhizomicrobium sp.]|jgi:predicted nicotinamide N-methyase|nr:50S ribosomal protein L11 methyltransferase [Rhizomicrobium sp.]
MNSDQFVRDNTELIAPPLVPEITLHLASEVVPLWRKTEEELAEIGVPPPYWAFAWAGGQALARYILDHPDLVLGKRVLDFGAGSGVVALAAARAGADHVIAADIDSFAVAAISRNAKANALALEAVDKDMIGSRDHFDLILVGDMCYERPLAERLMAWLKETQADILLGDPGRTYFPKTGLTRLATYNVPTTRELEDREIRETSVWRLDRA